MVIFILCSHYIDNFSMLSTSFGIYQTLPILSYYDCLRSHDITQFFPPPRARQHDVPPHNQFTSKTVPLSRRNSRRLPHQNRIRRRVMEVYGWILHPHKKFSTRRRITRECLVQPISLIRRAYRYLEDAYVLHPPHPSSARKHKIIFNYMYLCIGLVLSIVHGVLNNICCRWMFMFDFICTNVLHRAVRNGKQTENLKSIDWIWRNMPVWGLWAVQRTELAD